MAVNKDLCPALVRDGGEEVEALTVDIFVKKMGITCTTAYGPQENDLRGKKESFWKFLGEEAARAKTQGKGFILQGDLNAWLGKNIISKDLRKQNENGKLMENFLTQNNLTVVNGLDLCKGVFTRIQKRQGIFVMGILDFFVVCNRIISLISGMEVDDLKKNVPTNYTQLRKGGKAVDSDHMVIELSLNMKVLPTRPTREIIYNFKNKEGQQIFKHNTSDTNEFSNCFSSVEPLLVQCDRWKNILEAHCKKAFPQIRIRKGKLLCSKADILIKKRNALKKKQDDEKTNCEEDGKLLELEKLIGDIHAEEGREKALKFKQFSAQNGSVSVHEMWKLKKKLWPKNRETIPTGKFNHQGRLVTCPQDIKNVLTKEYRERLRPRPSHPDFKNIDVLKKESFKVKLEKATNNQSPYGI